ncbi:hypothetical protein [Amycolatopsis sp. NPDC051903]|uniref:hypothetical protein n=1 Tax=Amycolatopsis sp. NPDC051903 TaxID=3363936 RepID=UPI0037A9A908
MDFSPAGPVPVVTIVDGVLAALWRAHLDLPRFRRPWRSRSRPELDVPVAGQSASDTGAKP